MSKVFGMSRWGRRCFGEVGLAGGAAGLEGKTLVVQVCSLCGFRVEVSCHLAERISSSGKDTGQVIHTWGCW